MQGQALPTSLIAKMKAQLAFVCAALLLAGACGCPTPVGRRKLLQTPYASNLADCVAKAGLKSVAAVIAAASIKTTELFTNGQQSLTFFAPNDATFQQVAKTANTSVTGLINQPGFADYFLRNHLMQAARYTSFWPATGEPGKFLTSIEGTSLQLWSDTQYTQRIMGLYNTKSRVACSMSNFQCGNAVMHVIVDPELPTQR